MERLALLFLAALIGGCALQVRTFDDPWRERIRACGTAIGSCERGAVW